MTRRTELLVLCLLLAIGAAQAGVRMYDVDVYRNLNGRVYGQDGVSQSFVNTADTISWVEFFVGAANTPGPTITYNFDIRDQATNQVVYSGNTPVTGQQHYEFVRCTSFTRSAPLVNGKGYTLKITISNSNESLNYYYDTLDPHPYGGLTISGPDKTQNKVDLVARIEGANRVVDGTFFAMNGVLAQGDVVWLPSVLHRAVHWIKDAGMTCEREYFGDDTINTWGTWGPGDIAFILKPA